MPDVGKQTKEIIPLKCVRCGSYDTVMRLPRDTRIKKSFVRCNKCGHKEEFP